MLLSGLTNEAVDEISERCLLCEMNMCCGCIEKRRDRGTKNTKKRSGGTEG